MDERTRHAIETLLEHRDARNFRAPAKAEVLNRAAMILYGDPEGWTRTWRNLRHEYRWTCDRTGTIVELEQGQLVAHFDDGEPVEWLHSLDDLKELFVDPVAFWRERDRWPLNQDCPCGNPAVGYHGRPYCDDCEPTAQEVA